MSPYLADLMTARPRRREPEPRTFILRTSWVATPRGVDQLRRAFARTATDFSENVTGVEVSADRGCFLVAIETCALERRLVRECEELFAVAWYDAFGERSSPHVSWSSERCSPPARDREPSRSTRRGSVLRAI